MAIQKNKLKVTYLPVGKLKPSTYNPRRWTKQTTKNLTTSIKKYGLIDPIIINNAKKRKGVVIGGHFRLKIAKDLGYKTVPVVKLNIPDIEKEIELNLRLNKNTGDWDLELLKEMDIDLLLDTGFDDSDLSSIWDDLAEIESDDFNIKKEMEKIKKTDIKIGDLFQLGPHRLLCSDSTITKEVDKLLEKKQVDMVYCDPIYNISYNYNSGISAKNKYGGQINDNKTDKEYKLFLKQTMQNALKHCKTDCHFFYYSDQKYIWLIQTLYQELGIKNQRVCFWVKNNFSPIPQCAFNKAVEPCTYGTRGRPYISDQHKNLTEILNKEIDPGNRTIDDIIDIFDIWLAKRIAGQLYSHATEKSVTLHEKPLRRCTKVNDLVLDLFAGSGSTLIACHQLKRRAYLMEINPIFCQLILNRFKQLTGKDYEKLN